MSDIKTNIRIYAFFIFLCCSFVNCIAQFNVEKPNEGSFRTQSSTPKVLTSPGSDVFHTNPYVIVIADSTSSGQLSGKHLSQQLVSSYVQEIISVNSDASQILGDDTQFKNRFTAASDSAVKGIQSTVAAELKKVSQTAALDKNDQSMSANFISVTIDNSKGEYEPLLRIQQIGSARVVVFRRTEFKKKYYYQPVFGTLTSQSKQRVAHQFFAFQANTNLVLEQTSFEVSLDDLVVIGSNGLWNNLHLSFLTFLLNFGMRYGQGNLSNVIEHLKVITSGYQKVLDFDAELLKSTFISQYQPLKKGPVVSTEKEKQFKALLEQIKAGFPTSMPEDQKSAWISFFRIAAVAAQVIIGRPASNGRLVSQDLIDLLKNMAVDDTPSLSFISSDKAKYRTKLLADAAYEASVLTKFASPFCIESWNLEAKYEQCPETAVADDVTVVASSVVDADAPTKEEIDKFALFSSLKAREYLTRLGFEVRVINGKKMNAAETQQKVKELSAQMDSEIAKIWGSDDGKKVSEFKDRRVLSSVDGAKFNNRAKIGLI